MRSWLQIYALGVLLRQSDATLKDLRPTDVAANLFAYHLDGLIKDGLVCKTERGHYALAPQGLSFAGQLSTLGSRQAENLKTVIVLFARSSTGKILLFRWSRQPYLGEVTLPWDRLHFGGDLAISITTSLKDKLGTVVESHYLTSVILKVTKGDHLISHMNGLVFEIRLDDDALPRTVRNGEAFWGDTTDADIVAGLPELVDYIARHSYQGLREFTLESNAG